MILEEITIIDYIKISVSILSIIFGIWQYLQKRRIKKLIATEAVELHKNIAVVLGATQAAKNAITNNISPNFEIGRAEGLSQAILYESAKLYCNLNDTKIDDFIISGQLDSNYKLIYYSFSDGKRGYFLKKLKEMSKLF